MSDHNPRSMVFERLKTPSSLLPAEGEASVYGRVQLTAEVIIWYCRALAAGDAESVAPEATILRNANWGG